MSPLLNSPRDHTFSCLLSSCLMKNKNYKIKFIFCTITSLLLSLIYFCDEAKMIYYTPHNKLSNS